MKRILCTVCIVLIVLALAVIAIRDRNRAHRVCNYNHGEWLEQYADSDSSVYKQWLRYEK